MSGSELVQTDLKIFQTTKGYFFLDIIYCSFSQSRASHIPEKPEQRSLPPLCCLLSSSPCPMQSFCLGFLSWCRGEIFIVPCKTFPYSHLSVYTEVWGSNQAFSSGLDQPLSMVSLSLELSGEDGSEEDILTSLFGNCWGFLISQEKIRLLSIMDFGNE